MGAGANAHQKLRSIDQWGDASWTTMKKAFDSMAFMVNRATDAPDLSRVTDMSEMFRVAYHFNADLSSWDVSNVRNMYAMFTDDIDFNGDISGWNVSSVTNMSEMFGSAESFNQNISGWNVSSVTNMHEMFHGAQSFNGDISSWDVSNVRDMSASCSMGANSFRQNLGEWYIVPDGLSIPSAGDYVRVWAQNRYLDRQGPVYSVNDTRFVFDGRTLEPNPANPPVTGSYALRISAGGGVFGAGNSLDVVIDVATRQFVTTWQTTAPGQTVTIPVGGSTATYNVNWGDGTLEEGVSGDQTHAYPNAGSHTVVISGNFERIRLAGDGSDAARANAARLASIDSWGEISWTSMEGAFAGAASMTYKAADAPDLSGVRDTSLMFANASAFNGDISSWDVSRVTNMESMFAGAHSFSQNLGEWYIVPDRLKHLGAARPIVVSAQNAFLDGQDPVYAVNDTRFVFDGQTLKTNPDDDLASGSYALRISAGDDGVFGAGNSLDVVIDLTGRPFVTTWRTTSANETIYLSVRGSNMAIDWGDGHVSRVTSRTGGTENHSYENAGDHTVSVHGGLQRVSVNDVAQNNKLRSIDQWGDASWTTMRDAFNGAWIMTSDATDIPDLSRVTDMYFMFGYAYFFNGNVSGWDVSNVRNMQSMFADSARFNGNVSGWDVSSVTNMNSMFASAKEFNGDISSWDVSGVKDMDNMFFDAESFDQDISGWNVSGVTDMSSMFSRAASFNQDISSWDVSGATDMRGMFSRANSFEQNLGEWYIVPDDLTVSSARDAVRISAQNSYLDGQNPAYRLNGTAGDGGKFRMAGDALALAPDQNLAAGNYTVTIKADRLHIRGCKLPKPDCHAGPGSQHHRHRHRRIPPVCHHLADHRDQPGRNHTRRRVCCHLQYRLGRRHPQADRLGRLDPHVRYRRHLHRIDIRRL